MKKYLSIGQVSKIKGVSKKSLRYYGELGILPPIYINEKTGYRYYSVEQLIIIDFILICVNLNIPLKQFKNYITENGEFNIKQLIEDGESIAKEKISKLNDIVFFLNTMSEHVLRTHKVKKNNDSFLQYINKRYFLICEVAEDVKLENHIKKHIQNKKYSVGSLVIFKQLFDYNVKIDSTLIEVQVLKL